MRKPNETFSSFTVEDDLISETSFASNTRLSGFPTMNPRVSQKRQEELKMQARQEFFREQTDNLVDPFKHRLAAGFAGSEEEIYQREKERLERELKKKEEERMTGCTSYTIVFNDKKGQAVIQMPQDPNVFKMAANRMLDEQAYSNESQQQAYVRPPPKKRPSKPIPQIVESDNDDEPEAEAFESVPKWQPKSNNFLGSSSSMQSNKNNVVKSNNSISSPKSVSVKMPSKQPNIQPAAKKEQPKQSVCNGRPPKPAVPKQSATKPQPGNGVKKYSEVYEGADRALVEQLERELVECPTIGFDDIADLDTAKNLLQEAVLLPRLMPEFFQGIRRATKGVMLFGPPGTGKTLLAKAVSKGNVFFNVSASSLASKWKGESEKLVRILFEMAKYHAPSVIFFDEIDAIGSKRSSDENEANRKVKSELLVQMDGASGSPDKQVFVLAATNRPWDIDEALRRRLEKRIYIPLPTAQGRRKMFEINLKDIRCDEKIDWNKIVKITKDYSGADIAIVCREAAYMPMRKHLAKLGGFSNISEVKQLESTQKQNLEQLDVPLTEADFMEAIKNVNKSVSGTDLKRYEEWMKEFGSS